MKKKQKKQKENEVMRNKRKSKEKGTAKARREGTVGTQPRPRQVRTEPEQRPYPRCPTWWRTCYRPGSRAPSTWWGTWPRRGLCRCLLSSACSGQSQPPSPSGFPRPGNSGQQDLWERKRFICEFLAGCQLYKSSTIVYKGATLTMGKWRS